MDASLTQVQRKVNAFRFAGQGGVCFGGVQSHLCLDSPLAFVRVVSWNGHAPRLGSEAVGT